MLMFSVGLLIFCIVINLIGIGASFPIIYKNNNIGIGLFLLTANTGMLAWNIVRLLDKLNLIEHLNSV